MGGNKAGDKTALSVPSPSLFRNVLPASQMKWPWPPDAILTGKNPIRREACRGRWGKVDSLGWWEAQPTKVPRPTKESHWEALKP